MVVLGVSGYREFTDYELFKSHIDKIKNIDTIISGGCRGTDKLAEKYAVDNNINLVVLEADWSLGRSAGPLRNTKIVDQSDIVIAFLHPNSKGTKDTINKAKKANKLYSIVNI